MGQTNPPGVQFDGSVPTARQRYFLSNGNGHGAYFPLSEFVHMLNEARLGHMSDHTIETFAGLTSDLAGGPTTQLFVRRSELDALLKYYAGLLTTRMQTNSTRRNYHN